MDVSAEVQELRYPQADEGAPEITKFTNAEVQVGGVNLLGQVLLVKDPHRLKHIKTQVDSNNHR